MTHACDVAIGWPGEPIDGSGGGESSGETTGECWRSMSWTSSMRTCQGQTEVHFKTITEKKCSCPNRPVSAAVLIWCVCVFVCVCVCVCVFVCACVCVCGMSFPGRLHC